MIWTTRQRSDFGALRAVRTGQGLKVLFLHGVGLRAEAWGGQIEEFARDYTVIAPDMPGHGESNALVKPDPALADYVAEVRSALAGERGIVVVGHSMGAMIALQLAAHAPELVRGVVALNAIYRRSAAATAAVVARAARLDGVSLPDPSQTLARWFDDLGAVEALACREWLMGVDPMGYRAAYKVFAREDGPAAADLEGLAMPALFMTGEKEPNSTGDMSREMARLAPQGEVQILAGAAHMMPMTHAGEVNGILAQFFRRCAA